jgi:hypothetical protein
VVGRWRVADACSARHAAQSDRGGRRVHAWQVGRCRCLQRTARGTVRQRWAQNTWLADGALQMPAANGTRQSQTEVGAEYMLGRWGVADACRERHAAEPGGGHRMWCWQVRHMQAPADHSAHVDRPHLPAPRQALADVPSRTAQHPCFRMGPTFAVHALALGAATKHGNLHLVVVLGPAAVEGRVHVNGRAMACANEWAGDGMCSGQLGCGRGQRRWLGSAARATARAQSGHCQATHLRGRMSEEPMALNWAQMSGTGRPWLCMGMNW